MGQELQNETVETRGRKLSDSEVEERLEFVGSLMVEMTPIKKAFPLYQEWTIKKYDGETRSRSQYYEDRKAFKELLLKRMNNEDFDEELAFMLEVLEHNVYLNYEKGHSQSAANALALLAKLKGLSIEKVDHRHQHQITGDVSVNFNIKQIVEKPAKAELADYTEIIVENKDGN